MRKLLISVTLLTMVFGILTIFFLSGVRADIFSMMGAADSANAVQALKRIEDRQDQMFRMLCTLTESKGVYPPECQEPKSK